MSPHKNQIVYCKDVAKKLGIKGHSCRRKYFLDTKNLQRHKLHSFCLNVPSESDYVCDAFQVHPFIYKASRVPVEERIKKLMGGKKFELCDYLRNKINTICNALQRCRIK